MPYPTSISASQNTLHWQNPSPPANWQIPMKSCVTHFTPEELHQPRVWFCLSLIISVCKRFLPGQASTKSGQLLGYEHYHTCSRRMPPLLGKLTFRVHSSDDSNITVDQNSTLISFLNTGDSFCWVQVLLLFHQRNSAAELKAGLGSAFFNRVNVILWQFSF